MGRPVTPPAALTSATASCIPSRYERSWSASSPEVVATTCSAMAGSPVDVTGLGGGLVLEGELGATAGPVQAARRARARSVWRTTVSLISRRLGPPGSPPRGSIPGGLGPQVREQDHVSDGGHVGQDHREPVDAETEPAGGRHPVFEGPNEVLVERMGLLITPPARFLLRGEAGPLVVRIGHLRVGRPDLHTPDVEVEVLRDPRRGPVRPG